MRGDRPTPQVPRAEHPHAADRHLTRDARSCNQGASLSVSLKPSLVTKGRLVEKYQPLSRPLPIRWGREFVQDTVPIEDFLVESEKEICDPSGGRTHTVVAPMTQGITQTSCAGPYMPRTHKLNMQNPKSCRLIHLVIRDKANSSSDTSGWTLGALGGGFWPPGVASSLRSKRQAYCTCLFHAYLAGESATFLLPPHRT